MASTKPYLIRAMYEWMTDSQFTPLLLVDAIQEGVQVPASSVVEGKVVFNISSTATGDLELGNDWISFNARFNGAKQNILIPVAAVTAIYARENGEGMTFEVGVGPEPTEDGAGANPETAKASASKAASKGPGLKLVK